MYLDNRNGLMLTLIKIGNESNIQKTLAVANFYQSTKVDTIGRHGKLVCTWDSAVRIGL
jgi:hypothetical protein